MLHRKQLLITIGIILLVLVLTNPTPTDFRNYMGINGSNNSKGSSVRRVSNFLVCSKYETPHELDQLGRPSRYFAIIKIFFKYDLTTAEEKKAAEKAAEEWEKYTTDSINEAMAQDSMAAAAAAAAAW